MKNFVQGRRDYDTLMFWDKHPESCPSLESYEVVYNRWVANGSPQPIVFEKSKEDK